MLKLRDLKKHTFGRTLSAGLLFASALYFPIREGFEIALLGSPPFLLLILIIESEFSLSFSNRGWSRRNILFRKKRFRWVDVNAIDTRNGQLYLQLDSLEVERMNLAIFLDREAAWDAIVQQIRKSQASLGPAESAHLR